MTSEATYLPERDPHADRPDGPRAGRREWTALAVLMLALLLVSMDASVLFFAIPSINADLAPTGTQQLWIFDIYGFVLSGLLMTMGALGDRIGRRRLLMCGAAAFGAASVAAAYATSPGMLIAARAVLGIGGATLMPSTMGLIRSLFRDARQRAQAIGVWTTVMTSGIALGSVASGLLVEHFWWGSVFLVNLPAMVLLLVLAPLLIPEYRTPGRGRFDLLSVPLSMATVLPVVYALKEIPSEGMRPAYGGWLALGLVCGALFVRRQRTVAHPMLPPALLRVRGYTPSAVLATLATFGMMGSAFFTTQYLQSVLGNSALEAALWSLVPSLPIAGAAPAVTALVQRGVPRSAVVTGGFLLGAAGYGLLTLPGTDALALVLVGAGVLAVGVVTVLSQLMDLAMGSVPVERAGSASALLETGQEFGGALGLAILGSVATALYRDRVSNALPGVPAEARETLGGALAVARELPGAQGESLLRTARGAFTSGMHGAAYVCVALFLCCAVGAALSLRSRPGPAAKTGARTEAEARETATPEAATPEAGAPEARTPEARAPETKTPEITPAEPTAP